MNERDIKEAIDRLDRLSHPYLYFMNPADYDNCPSDVPEYKYIFPDECVEKGKVIVVDRNAMYEWNKKNLWKWEVDDGEEN